MDEILGYLTSPGWWFSVVAAGLVINLAAAYIKQPIDAALTGVSGRWRARTAAERERHERLILGLLQSTPDYRLAARIHGYIAGIKAEIEMLVSLVMVAFAVSAKDSSRGASLTFLVAMSTGAVVMMAVALSNNRVAKEAKKAFHEVDQRLIGRADRPADA